MLAMVRDGALRSRAGREVVVVVRCLSAWPCIRLASHEIDSDVAVWIGGTASVPLPPPGE